MQRKDALALVKDWVKNANLINHILAVEAAMRFYALARREDEEQWGLAGLLHDADWEKYPAEHPQVVLRWLKEKGADPALMQAINAHGGKDAIPPRSDLDKYLFACDELCGFVVAVARMRPGKLDDLQAASVKKKIKDKAFAANVSREDIIKGAELIGIDLDQHITHIIAALKPLSSQLFHS